MNAVRTPSSGPKYADSALTRPIMSCSSCGRGPIGDGLAPGLRVDLHLHHHAHRTPSVVASEHSTPPPSAMANARPNVVCRRLRAAPWQISGHALLRIRLALGVQPAIEPWAIPATSNARAGRALDELRGWDSNPQPSP